MGDTAKFGIDSIPSTYIASIADIDTNTFYIDKQLIELIKNNKQMLKLFLFMNESK